MKTSNKHTWYPVNVKMPLNVVDAIEHARLQGLFVRTRSQYIRDAVSAMLASDLTAKELSRFGVREV